MECQPKHPISLLSGDRTSLAHHLLLLELLLFPTEANNTFTMKIACVLITMLAGASAFGMSPLSFVVSL
jgi:hypothetical protein